MKLRADKNNPDSQWWVVTYDEAQRPIAAGNPPLTERMVSHYITFVAWLLEIPVTQTLKDRLRAILLEDWKIPKERESDLKTLDHQLKMSHRQYGDVERLYERSVIQQQMIQNLRADKGTPEAQLLLPAYDSAHPLIAAGNPPLTRQASDAWTEFFCFIRNQSGAPKMEATAALKEDFAHSFTANWAAYSPEQRKTFSEMPQYWAFVRLAWVKESDAGRQRILAAWQPVIHPNQPDDQQLAAAQAAVARANEFVKRDANTMSEQELLEAAKDADIVALYSRRAGDPQGLANAASWEERARLLRSGKAAWVQQQVNERAKAAIVDEYLKTQIINRALTRQLPRVR